MFRYGTVLYRVLEHYTEKDFSQVTTSPLKVKQILSMQHNITQYEFSRGEASQKWGRGLPYSTHREMISIL